MFVGFDINLQNYLKDNLKYYNIGKKLYRGTKNDVEKQLKNYICDKKIINGTLLQKDWFPQVKADVFISHSHTDEKLAITLAGWLSEKFGIVSFIDSSIWGYSSDLLNKLNEEYSVMKKEDSGEITYYHSKANYSASHVHMMLTNALTRMIDRSECVFFLNTSNTINVPAGYEKSRTSSPWIYLELSITEMIRSKKLALYREDRLYNKAMFEASNLNISYKVNTEHLYKLKDNDLINWEKKHKSKNKVVALDGLYMDQGILSDLSGN